METTYALTRDDFARFQKILARRFKRRTSLYSVNSLILIFFWMFVGMAGASYLQLLERFPAQAGSLYLFGAFVVLAVVALLGLATVQRSSMRKQMLLPDGAFLSSQTIRVTETALCIETERLRSQLGWSAIVGVEQDTFNYYLFIDAAQAIIVPKAAASTYQAEFERYLAGHLLA